VFGLPRGTAARFAGGWEALAWLCVAVGDCATDLGGDLLVEFGVLVAPSRFRLPRIRYQFARLWLL
jgi:hypothetical protein